MYKFNIVIEPTKVSITNAKKIAWTETISLSLKKEQQPKLDSS